MWTAHMEQGLHIASEFLQGWENREELYDEWKSLFSDGDGKSSIHCEHLIP